MLCRTLAGLGIGGEWGIGATLIAESGAGDAARGRRASSCRLPHRLASCWPSAVNYQMAGVWFAGRPAELLALRVSGRTRTAAARRSAYVCSCTRAPSWQASRAQARGRRCAARAVQPPGCARATARAGCSSRSRGGAHLVGLQRVHPVARWPAWRHDYALTAHLVPEAARRLSVSWQARGANAFNVGGLVGALRRGAGAGAAAAAAARSLVGYFLYLPPPPSVRPLGSSSQPQHAAVSCCSSWARACTAYSARSPSTCRNCFPRRLRATGAGFCYNIGRVFAAAGPLIVGAISAAAGGSSRCAHRNTDMGGAGAARWRRYWHAG